MCDSHHSMKCLKFSADITPVSSIWFQDSGIDFGDISDRKALRKRLQCKTFRWYLVNMYPEMRMYSDTVAYGAVSCLHSSSRPRLTEPLICTACVRIQMSAVRRHVRGAPLLHFLLRFTEFVCVMEWRLICWLAQAPYKYRLGGIVGLFFPLWGSSSERHENWQPAGHSGTVSSRLLLVVLK